MKSADRFKIPVRIIRVFRMLLLSAFIIFLAILFHSVADSGLHYQFDIDEYFFAQSSYLYMTGFRPYLDVYTSVYPPIFSWATQFIFLLKGFTFDALYFARYIMVILLAVRLMFAFFTLQLLFSRTTALLFLPLFLFDPFGVFTTMQYRPDNLMLTVFTVGLYYFTNALLRKKHGQFVLAGLLMGTSVLILPKIAPSIAALTLVYGIWCLRNKTLPSFFRFLLLLAAPFALFSAYQMTQHSFGAMVTQTFFDIKSLYSNFSIPLPINIMMRPDNAFIFGVMGKPITWVYLWLIAPLGLMGAYHAIYKTVTGERFTPASVLRVGLVLAMIGQWGVLFGLQVVFIQHYMSFHWIAIALAAYAFDELYGAIKRFSVLSIIASVMGISLMLHIGLISIRNNRLRATITNPDERTRIESRWKQIPAGEAIFPGYLFRPPTFPLPYGGFIVNMPQPIIDTLPDIASMLSVRKPRLLLDEYTLTHLPARAQEYIYANYDRVPGDPELMVHK